MEITKIINIVGLTFDIIGVSLLIINEIRNRRIEILSEKSLNKQDYIDVYELSKKGEKINKTEEDFEIEKINLKNPLEKIQNITYFAFSFIILGFLLQIVSNIIS